MIEYLKRIIGELLIDIGHRLIRSSEASARRRFIRMTFDGVDRYYW